MSSAKMIGIEMTPPRQLSILCCVRSGRERESSSNALQYVVFQLDDDIVFKLNENCTVFYLMKLFPKNQFNSCHSGHFISLALPFLHRLFIHLFVRSFIRSFVATIAFTFQIEVLRTQIDNVTVFHCYTMCTLISVEFEPIWIVAQAF